MQTTFLYNTCAWTAHVHRAPCRLSCSKCTVSDLEQTANCLCQACCGVTVECEAGSHALGQQVLDPPLLPDSLAGQASEHPTLHRSHLFPCLAWKAQKYLVCTHQACFSKPGLTVVRKTTPPLPSLHCSVSRGQPVTGTHISKLLDVKTVLSSLSWRGY